MRTAKEKSDVPKGLHFAALVFSTITIPGDQRSRDCPGHGYPESRQSIAQYIVFSSEDECTKWVASQPSSGSTDFIILLANRLTVQTEVKVRLRT